MLIRSGARRCGRARPSNRLEISEKEGDAAWEEEVEGGGVRNKEEREKETSLEMRAGSRLKPAER